jgi:hypothetical protein
MTGIDLAFDVAGNIVDAVQISDGCSAELHYDACHKPLPQQTAGRDESQTRHDEAS